MTKRAEAAPASRARRPSPRKKTTPRARRSAEEARRRILDATERRLIQGGPEAVRLQDIAADVGISHPGLLHHFGSRDRLLAALAERAIVNLGHELLDILATRREGDPLAVRTARAATLFERMHDLWTTRGYARLFAGLILSGRKIQKRMRGIFREFAEAMHEHRAKRRAEDGRPPPSWEETGFGVTLVWITLFGDALFGPIARGTVGLSDDAATGRRFRQWMAERFEEAGPSRSNPRSRH